MGDFGMPEATEGQKQDRDAFFDTILEYLKLLGYPFIVNKSTLQAIATPRAKSIIFGIIDWLVQALIYQRDTNVEMLLYGQKNLDMIDVQKELLRITLKNEPENVEEDLKML